MPVTFNVWATVLLPPRFTVVTPVLCEVEPIFKVAQVVVSALAAVEWPILMVLFSVPVRVVPKFKVLKVVPLVPAILEVVPAPLKVTVPLLWVNVPPLFSQLPATFIFVFGAVSAPLIVTLQKELVLDPEMAVVPLKVTVPVPGVKVPLLVQLPATFMF